MFRYLYFMEFLYFPEDKADYIPGIISLVIFICGAVIAMYIIMKKSKKDEEKFEEKYFHIDHQNTDEKK